MLMYIFPRSIVYLKIPIFLLNLDTCSSLHYFLTSSSGRYPGGEGPVYSLFPPLSYLPSSDDKSLMAPTAALTHFSLYMLHAEIGMLGIWNFLIPAPRYNSGGPYSSFLIS